MTADFLRITDNNGVYVYLDGSNSSNISLRSWTPSPGRIAASLTTSDRGGELASYYRESTTQTIDININDTPLNAQASMQQLQRFFEQQVRRQKNPRCLNPVDLEVKWADGYWWGTEILYGQVQWVDEPFGPSYAACEFRVRLILQCRPYFERIEYSSIELYNSISTSPTTDYLTVSCINDGTHDNWCEISSTATAGDLPSPAYLEIDRTDTGNCMGKIIVAQSAYADHSVFNPVLEGESATYKASGYTTPTLLTLSNGARVALNWQPTTGWQKLLAWDLSPTQMAAMKGELYQVWAAGSMSRNGATDGSVQYKMRLCTNYGSGAGKALVYQESDVYPSTTTTSLHKLAAFRFPPATTVPISAENITLELYGRGSDYFGTHTQIDFIHLTPTFGVREFTPIDSSDTNGRVGFRYQGTLHDRQRDQMSYTVDSVTPSDTLTHVATGSLMILPRKAQRLYFLWEDSGKSQLPTSMRIKLRYRPRRASL